LEVARRLSRRGARKLTLTTRQATISQHRQAVLDELRGQGVQVSVVQADAARREDVERLFERWKDPDARLAGVFHLTGVLSDGVLLQQSWDKFESVLGPKSDGARLLHEFTADWN